MSWRILLAIGAWAATVGCTSTPISFSSDRRQVSKNLETFDDLDFNVFTHQKWDELHKSHSKDVIVHWPDGRITAGIDAHIEDLKKMFEYAPDTRINQHPIKLGSGQYTAVTGTIEG